MFLAGAASIEAKKEYINELNVFLYLMVIQVQYDLDYNVCSKGSKQLNNPSIETLSKAISSGSLRGSRGNSESYCRSCF